MKKIEILLYNFNELSEEVRRKLIEREIERIIDDNFECLPEYFEEMMEEEEIDDLKISYSLSYSQGDGVSFEGVINFEKENIFKKVLDNSRYKQDIIKLLNDGYTFRLIRKNYNYYHKYTCGVDCDAYFYDEKISEILEVFHQDLEGVYYNLCNRYEKLGYNCYNVSEEEAIERILEKDLLYFEDGRIYE